MAAARSRLPPASLSTRRMCWRSSSSSVGGGDWGSGIEDWELALTTNPCPLSPSNSCSAASVSVAASAAARSSVLRNSRTLPGQA